MNEDNGIGVAEAEAFLAQYYSVESHMDLTVEHIGEGAWSRCFGFRHGDEDLAIRFGHYIDDFQVDQLAYRYASPALPIPEVRAIGKAYDGYYAISTRVRGVPLESVNAAQWRAVIPSVVDALEAMRTADISATTGFGGWGEGETGSCATWSEHLLTVDNDLPEYRTYGWRAKLAESAEHDATFRWGYELLQKVVSDAIPRGLLHCDLINRNALVANNRLSGIFDWGCSRYGDHLYELAWFEFWGSWYPELDMTLLRSTLEQRWRDVGYEPSEKDARLLTCYLHIGLDHFAYNAYLGDWDALAATSDRMKYLATTV